MEDTQTLEFEFVRREREILELLCLGSVPKQIAAELEITTGTVNANIGRACQKAQVSRAEVLVYVLQHPPALDRGGRCLPGLHERGCLCGSPYCAGMRSRVLKAN